MTSPITSLPYPHIAAGSAGGAASNYSATREIIVAQFLKSGQPSKPPSKTQLPGQKVLLQGDLGQAERFFRNCVGAGGAILKHGQKLCRIIFKS